VASCTFKIKNETYMNNPSEKKSDFRAPTTGKRAPRAVADAIGGIIVAVAEVGGSPESAFRALFTDEVMEWWKMPGVYHWTDWQAELRVCGPWMIDAGLPSYVAELLADMYNGLRAGRMQPTEPRTTETTTPTTLLEFSSQVLKPAVEATLRASLAHAD
jgi:hypothetical protein